MFVYLTLRFSTIPEKNLEFFVKKFITLCSIYYNYKKKVFIKTEISAPRRETTKMKQFKIS